MPDDKDKAAPPVENTGPVSINEPPGVAAPPAPAPEPLPSDAELSAMTRAELDALASERGLDSTGEATKADVIALLKGS